MSRSEKRTRRKRGQEMVEALNNFRGFFTSESLPVVRVRQLIFRLVVFLVTLFSSWSLFYWAGTAFLGSVSGYFPQLVMALATLVASVFIMAVRDFRLIHRGRAPDSDHGKFPVPSGQLVLGVSAVLVLFIVSWSFVYLLFGQLGLFLAPGAGYGPRLLTFLTSLFAAYGILLPIGWLSGTRLKEFSSMLNGAVERIAQGDFSVNLPWVTHNAGTHFDTLIVGVNKMTESLKAMDRMRQEFVANVSHEIQTPLTNISGYAEALKDSQLPEETRQRYLGIVQDEAHRLSHLAEHLLRLSSLDAEARTVVSQSYRLDTQIREVVLALEVQWAAKGLDVVVDLEPVTVRADQELLAQVWLNLFQNAVKFTPEGGRVGVKVSGSETVEARFFDHGVGIAPEDLPRVFDRFFKADASRSRSLGGNGLGLAVVKKIVELHQGTVDASSPGPGQGSEFVVRLPRGLR